MSVPEQTTFTSSTANGVTTVFPYGFMIADADDLTVEIDGVVQTVGFTVSDVGNPAGGNVTFSIAPANGANVLLYLDPALKRDEDYPQFGDLLASVLNLDFDRVWLAMQALIARADRSIKLPVDTVNEQLISEPAATRAGKLLGFNDDGDAALYAAADVPVTAVSPYIATLLNDVSAEEARATLGVLSKFTAAGTADAMTGSLADSIITSYVAGLRVTATPPGANTVIGPTLNLNSLGTKTIKKRDSSGTKVALVAGDYNASGPFDFEYDGTDFILLNPLPAAVVSSSSVPVRQTVLSGPVDSNGFSAFGGSTGSTTVTASGTLKATAAAGGDANYTGSITNPSWTGLSTNGTMYLYLDITSGGVVTTGSTTLAPTYQWGGTYSTTNNQNTYNIQEMTMKVGNGSTASQVYRVFVGEVTVTGGVTTAITWYQLMGRFVSTTTNTLPGLSSSVSANHNLGIIPKVRRFVLTNITAEGGYTTGQEIGPYCVGPSSGYSAAPIPAADRLSMRMATGATIAFGGFGIAGGGAFTLTAANWSYRWEAERGW